MGSRNLIAPVRVSARRAGSVALSCLIALGLAASGAGAQLTPRAAYTCSPFGSDAIFSSHSAHTAACPGAVTTAATAVTASTATLNGSVNPGSQATTYHFDYGTNATSFGSTTTPGSFDGTQPAAVNVSAPLTGLSPGTYYFRLEVTNASGTVYGGTQTVVVGAAVVVTSPAIAVSATIQTINGSVDATGLASTYQFQYSTDLSYSSSTPVLSAGSAYGAIAHAATLTGLTTGTLYHFRIAATNAAGTVYGNDQTFTPGQPGAQTGLPSRLSSTSETLTGTIDPDGVATNYHFDYGTTSSYGQSTTAASAGSGTANVAETTTLDGLTAGVTYHVRIVATNSTGVSYGADATFSVAQSFATTNPATAPTADGATLNGQVGAGGLPTTYYFQYGTDTGYGQTTSASDADSNDGAQPESALLSGLVTGTTYHYQLVATNTDGTFKGVDQTFVPGQAVAVTGSAATASDVSESVDGNADPAGVDTSVDYQYGTTTAYGASTTPADAGAGTAPIDEPATLAGLAPGTTYHYRIVATNTTGTSYGADATFTTQAAPSATTTAASGLADTAAVVNATVNPNGFATTVQFQYGLDASYGSTSNAQSIGAGAADQPVNAQLSGLTAATTYTFRVVVSNGLDTVYGSPLTFTTASSPSAPVVSGSAVSAITDTSATLGATVNPEGRATSFQFVYGTTPSYGATTSLTSAGSGSADQAESAALSGLTPGTTYYYKLVATNTIATTNGAALQFTTPSPPTAATTTATQITPNSANVAGIVNPNGFATSYTFEYGADTSYGTSSSSQSAGSGAQAVPAGATLTGLMPATTYHFRIVASNGPDTVRGSDATFTTAPQPLAPVVTTAAVSALSDTGATLQGAVNPESQDTSYHFEYGADATYGSSSAPIDIGSGASAHPVSFVLTSLTPGAVCHYRLVATNATGTSDGPDQTFTPPVPPTASTLAATAITYAGAQPLASVNPTGFDTTYRFQYGTDGSYGSSTTSADAGSGLLARTVSATITGLAPSTTYVYRVVVSNGSDTVDGSQLSFTTAPVPLATAATAAASGLAAARATLNGLLNTLGQPASYQFQYGTDTGYGATTATVSTAGAAIVQPVAGVVADLQPGTTYHFRLAVTNVTGTSFGGDQTFTTPGSAPAQSTPVPDNPPASGGSTPSTPAPTPGSSQPSSTDSTASKASTSKPSSGGAGAKPPSGTAPPTPRALGVSLQGAAKASAGAGTKLMLDTGIAVSCPPAGACSVHVTVTAPKPSGGHAVSLIATTLTTPANASSKVLVALSSHAAALLRSAHKLHATIKVSASHSGAKARSLSRVATLTAPRG